MARCRLRPGRRHPGVAGPGGTCRVGSPGRCATGLTRFGGSGGAGRARERRGAGGQDTMPRSRAGTCGPVHPAVSESHKLGCVAILTSSEIRPPMARKTFATSPCRSPRDTPSAIPAARTSRRWFTASRRTPAFTCLSCTSTSSMLSPAAVWGVDEMGASFCSVEGPASARARGFCDGSAMAVVSRSSTSGQLREAHIAP